MQYENLNTAFIAASDAVRATADRTEISIENFNIAAEAITVADFAFEVARLIAEGYAPDAPEVVQYYQWTVMKLVELNGMMPEQVRADISPECFLPKTASAGEVH